MGEYSAAQDASTSLGRLGNVLKLKALRHLHVPMPDPLLGCTYLLLPMSSFPTTYSMTSVSAQSWKLRACAAAWSAQLQLCFKTSTCLHVTQQYQLNTAEWPATTVLWCQPLQLADYAFADAHAAIASLSRLSAVRKSLVPLQVPHSPFIRSPTGTAPVFAELIPYCSLYTVATIYVCLPCSRPACFFPLSLQPSTPS
jgi:hypothetical protein